MKKILIQMGSPLYANNALFNEDGNNMSNPWRVLRDRLAKLGYELVTSDTVAVNECEKIIFMDSISLGVPINFKAKVKNLIKRTLGIKNEVYPTRKLYEEAIAAGKRKDLILFIWEGKSVCPSNFYKSTISKFDKILTWCDDLVDNKKFFKFYLPLPPINTSIKIKPFSTKKLLVNISINRYSSYKHELYSQRKKSIDYFDEHYPNDFDLWGYRWGKPITRMQIMFPSLTKNYRTYRGQAKNKPETLSQYKFNICYENNSDAPGYVTEKIFDSLNVGIVPIYWGATNIEEYVDPNAFIDRRKFKNNKELVEFIRKIDEQEYNKYIEAGQKYIKSDKYAKFTAEYFAEIVINILNIIQISD